MTVAPQPEFSRPIPVDMLEDEAGSFEGAAEPDERAALALRYGAPAVSALAYEATIAPSDGGWRVTGAARAEITQTCVITLEPVESVVEERFERRYLPSARIASLELDMDADEAPEPLPEAIDLGEIAAEAIALGVDPYPRRPDARFEGRRAGPPGAPPLTEDAARPFAKLAALKRDGGRD